MLRCMAAMFFAAALELMEASASFAVSASIAKSPAISPRRGSSFSLSSLSMAAMASKVSLCAGSWLFRLLAASAVTESTPSFISFFAFIMPDSSYVVPAGVFVSPLIEAAESTLTLSSGITSATLTSEPSMSALPVTLISPALPPAKPSSVPSDSRLPSMIMAESLSAAPIIP